MILSLPSRPHVGVSVEKIEGAWPRDIVFLHGNLASRRWWYPSLELMKAQALKSRFTGSAYLLEFKGCGDSPAATKLGDVEMSLWAEEFLEALATLKILKSEINSQGIDLVGHSTGGLVAALMMSKRPAYFHKALLLDPVGAKGIKFEPSLIEAFAAMKSNDALTGQVIGSTIQGLNPEASWFRDQVVPDACRAVKSGTGAWVLQALDGVDFSKVIEGCKVPTAVLHGSLDSLLPLEESKSLAKLFSFGVFEEWVGQGHCGNVENPEGFVAQLKKHLL